MQFFLRTDSHGAPIHVVDAWESPVDWSDEILDQSPNVQIVARAPEHPHAIQTFTITVANGSATYHVVERLPHGYRTALVTSTWSEPDPPLPALSVADASTASRS